MPFTVRFNFAAKFNRLAIYRILPPIAVLKIVDFFIKFVLLSLSNAALCSAFRDFEDRFENAYTKGSSYEVVKEAI